MATHTRRWAPGTPCWIEIMVGDLERSQNFYRSVLGWEFVDSGPDYGHYNFAMLNGRRVAGISPPAPGDDEWPHVWTTYLASDEIEATAEKAEAAGAEALMEPMAVGDLARMGLWLDPTGVAFGAWDAREHTGYEAHHEPGAVGWIDLTTPSLGISKTFYAHVFGLTFDDMETPGMDYAMFTPEGEDVPVGGMGVLQPGDELGQRWCVTFEVDDVDAACDRVRAAGGEAPSEPYEFESGRIATVRGPDGEEFTLLTPAPTPEDPEDPSADDENFRWL
ncbi:hypothetical protein N802_04375 [Knoellia sinensis KCTC 19936]|uniref:VOC domain-containing protein n=1 Tax=Knoellia sinensis KCTC 19936 TaxID=1385520 RepID=A0A0A0J6U7_9MICO|nr:VOC family protein [Knoellia sinensis]KGN31331.1 hypothetical protein N802_04375 [Knoellia sinensis KCTC 19936]